MAAVAFVPHALWVLASAPLVWAIGAAATAALALFLPLALVDRLFYGSCQVPCHAATVGPLPLPKSMLLRRRFSDS